MKSLLKVRQEGDKREQWGGNFEADKPPNVYISYPHPIKLPFFAPNPFYTPSLCFNPKKNVIHKMSRNNFNPHLLFSLV